MSVNTFDDTIRQLLADRDVQSVLETTARQAHLSLDCDVSFVLSGSESDIEVIVSIGESIDYDEVTTPMLDDLVRSTQSKRLASILNDIAFTRRTATGTSTTSTDAGITPDTHEVSMDHATFRPAMRSVLLISIGSRYVFVGLDRLPNAFRRSTLETIEELFSYTEDALCRFDNPPDSDPDQSDHELSPTGEATSLQVATSVRPDGEGNDSDRITTEPFLRGIVHDMRNPLMVAKGRLQLVIDDLDDDTLQSDLVLVMDAIDRLEGLINDLDSLDTESTVTETEMVDLEDVVTHACEVVPTEDAYLSVPSSITFEADRNAISRLIENLIRNAVDHADSTVSVDIGRLGNDGFYVEDDGPGIPMEAQRNVFELGYTVDDIGTGIGLAIVEAIVDDHGWEIELVDETVGTRFEITGLTTSSND